MKDYLRKRWKNYWEKKGWFSKISDLVFVVLVIAMLIPASRKEISAFAAGIMASSPKAIPQESQLKMTPSDYNWQVKSFFGEAVSLSDFKNKVVFLNFWATWCPPCIAEMPDIQDFYDLYGDKVVFLLVTDENPRVVKSFMGKREFDMPVYFHDGAVPQIFSTRSIPTSFLIDKQGKVVIRKTGAAKWNSDKMHQLVDKLLAD